MSLTNPTAVVTEERLNEYHNTILPFLGGMPDILANKFARGDMYSTDEKMIGQWIDGKPLYQKWIDCGTQSAAATTVEVAHGISNIESTFIKHAYMTLTDQSRIFSELIPNTNSGSDFVGRVWVDGTKVYLYQMGGWAGYHAYVVVCYTKTTDSAIEIGIDTDYSTTEKIVGTWTDGRPVYQRTFYAENITINPQYTTVVWGNVPNIDILVNAFGMNDIGSFIPSYRHTSLSSDVTIDRTGGNIQTEFYRFGSGSFTTSAMLTAQYVKSV